MSRLSRIFDQAIQNSSNYAGHTPHVVDGDKILGRVIFNALGLAGEAGEVANIAKKCWRDKILTRSPDGDAVAQDLLFETADVMLYALMLVDSLDYSLEDLLEAMERKQALFLQKMEKLHNG